MSDSLLAHKDRLSAERHWEKEQAMLGPGLQAVVLWGGLCVEHAVGDYVFTTDGRRFLDFQGGAGVNHVGHSHPAVVSAVCDQVQRWMIGSWASRSRLRLLEEIQDFLPDGLERVQLYSSGTEAVEAALRLAKSYTGRHEVLSFWGGFHGKSLGSMALTSGGPRKSLGPLPTGFHSAPYANESLCPFGCSPRGCLRRCVDFTREKLEHDTTGDLAAIVVEGVQGRAGNVVPPPGYLRELKTLAHDTGALLIVDESMTGFGRTGRNFSYDHDDVVPDIVVVGKGMGSGYPITGVIASDETMSVGPYSEPSASSSSFGGFPAACAAAAASLKIIRTEGLVERAAESGTLLLDALTDRLADSLIVGEVRGKGLAIGIELVTDRESRTPLDKSGIRHVYKRLLERGLLVMTGGNTLRLYPPLNVGRDSINMAVDVLTEVLGQPIEKNGAEA
ncbi:MAG TPA: aspartate aminotransferase family protein [Candidatus Stackebrandtia faecavium]|nr:aspartate aminotransferase family protein [Candidatus Stackebrandtia faecavium]